MKTHLLYKIPPIIALMFCFHGISEAGKPVKTVPAAAAVLESVTVDWINQQFIITGSGFSDPGTTFTLAGIPVNDTYFDATTEIIPFNATVASIVTEAGNYNLVADGAIEMSVFVESLITDPGATGCPCTDPLVTNNWPSVLSPDLWSPDPANHTADCLEIEGPLSNDNADIAGIAYTDVTDPTVYPQYPIGASYYPADPKNSVCRLVNLTSSSPFGNDLITKRINELQQADCAAELKANVCSTVNGN